MYGSPSAVATKDFNIPLSRRKEESELQRQQQMSSGMLRYRSAPSSLLGEVCENFLHARPSSPETESIFARFLSSDQRDEKTTAGERNTHFKLSPETEQNSGFPCTPPQMLYHSQQQQSVTEEANPIRQSSSPAGFFAHLNVDNGYGLMRGMTAGMKGQISFSSRQNSLSQFSDMGSDGVSGDDRSPVESHNGHCFIPGYPVSSWEDSLLSDSISGFKRSRDVVGLNQTELHDREIKNHQVPSLTHQFSLPKTSSEIAAIDKLLQFQDSVPCKIRAKRGCATHPRSIAERVRRTRISERMRKLQELVPNMDKQTNTADMLDLAVDYIKDLQRQVKIAGQPARAQQTCRSHIRTRQANKSARCTV